MLTPDLYPNLPRIRFSINSHGRDKDWDYELLASKYEDKTGTLQDVVDHIKQGHAICAGLLGGQRRTKSNVIGSQWVLLDVDNSAPLLDETGKAVKDADGKAIKVYDPQLTIEQALQHSFIKQHCALIYTSASHKPDWHKFRLVFPLPQFESDVGIIEAQIRLLMEHLPHDPACKDASRVFYGNSRAEIPLFNPEACLPIEWREQALAAAADDKTKKEQQRQQREFRQAKYQRQIENGSVNREDTDALVLDALRFIPPREPGSGNYEDCLTVLMALYDHFGETEAERIAEQWSPSIAGTTWDISRKLKSFKRNGVTIGSLFHIAKQHGWKFPERPQTKRDRYPLELHRNTIEQVKQRADIVHIVGQHVELTKRGKDFVGLCPFHNEKTPSFSVSPSKQLYRCYGCGAGGNAIKFLMELGERSFTNVVLELAQRYQVEARWADGSPASAEDLRERHQWNEPNGDAYREHGAWEAEHERVAEAEKRERDRQAEERWQMKHGIPAFIKEKLGKIHNIFKGFGKPPVPPKPKASTPGPQPKNVQYLPEKLPTLEQYQMMGCPTIRFAAGQRLELIAELVALGWHDILDTSGTGGFKSHESGLATPEKFGVDRLWYFSEDHRNPTTATVEANYTDLPVRNDGMKVDSSRKTALNNPHSRWPKQGEEANTSGNCFRTKTFHALSAKGYKAAGSEAKENPICATCHMAALCKSSDKAGPGYSFRNDRRQAFASERIRSSVNSAPTPADLEAKVKTSSEGEETVSNRNAAFWDEAMQQIKSVETIESRMYDFDKSWAEIESFLPAIHEQLKPLRLTLRPILNNEIKQTQETYHGWDDATLRGILGKAPDNLIDIISQLEQIAPDLSEILKQPDGVRLAENRKSDRGTVKHLNKMLRQESYRDSLQSIQELATNWLIPFLEVWGGLKHGALRINKGVLTITNSNTRHAEIAQAMQFNVYLDATANRDYLALYLNISPDSVVQIQQETGSFENLTINQIDGLGLAGHNRSDSLKGKIVALKQEFKQHHPDIAFLDHKEHANAEEGDGWYFNHNRGSNEYKTRSAIATFGIPYQDIGSLQALYMTLTGDRNVDRDAPGFSAFVQWQTQSEIAQTVGRLRANLRPDEPTAYYSCADFDLSFLEVYYPGATIKKVSAFDITPQAGTRTEQRDWKVFSAARQVLTEAGVALEKMTQAMLAASAGVSQGRIAQIAAEYGGWGEFKKLLGTLLGVTYRLPNNFPPLDEEQELIANTYLKAAAESDPPPEAVEAMFHTAQVYGWRVFEAILAATSPETRGRLLAALVSGLSPALRDEFMAIAAEFQTQ